MKTFKSFILGLVLIFLLISYASAQTRVIRGNLKVPEYVEATDDLFDKLKLSFHTNLKGEINKVSSKLQEGVKEIVFERVIEGT